MAGRRCGRKYSITLGHGRHGRLLTQFWSLIILRLGIKKEPEKQNQLGLENQSKPAMNE